MKRDAITQALAEKTYLTFGGTETYLIYLQDRPLREFCAFEVVDDHAAWARMEDALLRPIADAAAGSGFGLLTDCLVWRASPDYVARLAPAGGLAEVNRRAVARTRSFVATWQAGSEAARATPVLVSGDLGPRGDGYQATTVTAEAAYTYHAPQVEALAAAGVDLVVALTMTSVGETLGVVRAAEQAGLAIVVSPTVETDGRLPDGTPLEELIAAVDGASSGYPSAYMANCAHPSHLAPTLQAAVGKSWLGRFRGLRANASTKSHAELDASTTLDRGNPAALARELAELRERFGFTIVGGCCGTDAEHLRAIAAACA